MKPYMNVHFDIDKILPIKYYPYNITVTGVWQIEIFHFSYPLTLPFPNTWLLPAGLELRMSSMS